MQKKNVSLVSRYPDSAEFWLYTHKQQTEASVFSKTFARLLETSKMNVLDLESTQKLHIGESEAKSHAIHPKVNVTWSDSYQQLEVFMEEQTKGHTKEGFKYSRFVRTLEQLNNFHQKLQEAFRKLHSRSRTYVETIQQIKDTKRRHDDNRKKYYEKMQKFLGYATGTKVAKMERTGGKVFERSRELAVMRFDIDHKLREFKIDQETGIITPICGIMEAYWDLISTGYKILEPMQQSIKEFAVYKTERVQAVEKEKSLLRIEREVFIAEIETWVNKLMDQVSQKGTYIRDLADDNDRPVNLACAKEGRLFNPYPNFCPVYCILKNSELRIQRDTVGYGNQGKADIILRTVLCTVKERRDLKMNNIFSIIPASQAPVLLQAGTQEIMHEWITVIQNSIKASLNENASIGKHGDQLKKSDLDNQLAQLKSVEGNDLCADCGAKDPTWVSLSIGVLVCTKCSGVHRNLGVQISKIRSCTLDELDDSMMAYLQCLGNAKVNSVYEAFFHKTQRRVTREHREFLIKEKYEEKRFLGNVTNSEEMLYNLNEGLFESIMNNQFLDTYRWLAWGAEPLWKNGNEEQRASIHHAVCYGSTVIVELLIQSSVRDILYAKDLRKWTPLHYAAYENDKKMAELLLQRGGERLGGELDKDGRTPFQIAEFYHQDNAKPFLSLRKETPKTNTNS